MWFWLGGKFFNIFIAYVSLLFLSFFLFKPKYFNKLGNFNPVFRLRQCTCDLGKENPLHTKRSRVWNYYKIKTKVAKWNNRKEWMTLKSVFGWRYDMGFPDYYSNILKICIVDIDTKFIFYFFPNSISLLVLECFREKRYQSVTALIGVNCFMGLGHKDFFLLSVSLSLFLSLFLSFCYFFLFILTCLFFQF